MFIPIDVNILTELQMSLRQFQKAFKVGLTRCQVMIAIKYVDRYTEPFKANDCKEFKNSVLTYFLFQLISTNIIIGSFHVKSPKIQKVSMVTITDSCENAHTWSTVYVMMI